MSKRTDQSLRGPICTVCGHVDSGKSSLLDFLRQSRVVDGEPGGITQKMGVTLFTRQRLTELTRSMNKPVGIDGIYFIDTPGHECFTAQRLCGIEISDIVVMVVDVFRGVEKQTIECIKLLQNSKTPFVIAVNKIDRIDGWMPKKMRALKPALKAQKQQVSKQLDEFMNRIYVQFAENEINVLPYYKNKEPKEYISMVPLSAKSGEGVPDLLMVINLLTTKFLSKRLAIKTDMTRGFVIEKFRDQKYGETVAAILTDGTLRSGDKLLMFDNHNEIIENRCRGVMVPEANKEVKDKFSLKGITEIGAAASVILRLENPEVRTGARFYVFHDDEERAKIEENMTIRSAKDINREYQPYGVFISAPTVGMADALYNLCQGEKIPVAGVELGPITKKCVIKAGNNAMVAKDKDDEIFNQRYSVILAYDTEPQKGVAEFAKEERVHIMGSNIVYRLVDNYKKFCDDLKSKILKRHPGMMPPCELSIFEEYIFTKRNPIIVGVCVVKNKIRPGIILEAIQGERIVQLGPIVSIQKNNKEVEEAKVGDEVCIKIDTKMEIGTDFDHCYILRTSYTVEDRDLINRMGNALGL